jgi:hypothetical protein
MMKYSIAITSALVSVLFVNGCSTLYPSIRSVTYAPDFTYVETAKIKSDMAKMARHIYLLDTLLLDTIDDPKQPDETHRKAVLSSLNTISSVAAGLKAKSDFTNHVFLEGQMQQFIAEVDRARVAASLPQPRYYFAGKVAGACSSCHTIHRE